MYFQHLKKTQKKKDNEIWKMEREVILEDEVVILIGILCLQIPLYNPYSSLDIVYPIARASTGRNAIEAPNWKSTGIPSTDLGVETVDDLQSWKARSI